MHSMAKYLKNKSTIIIKLPFNIYELEGLPSVLGIIYYQNLLH